MKIYHDNFADGWGALLREFHLADDMPEPCILFASYTEESYSGEAYVQMVLPNGSLAEVRGSHCSCHGLEDQWDIEDTTVEALRHEFQHGYGYGIMHDYKHDILARVEWFERMRGAVGVEHLRDALAAALALAS